MLQKGCLTLVLIAVGAVLAWLGVMLIVLTWLGKIS